MRVAWVGSVWVFCVIVGASAGAQVHAQAGAANRSEQAAPAGTVKDSDNKARQLFEAGRVAYDDGRFEAALQNFRAAYEMSDRAVLLFNIGMAAERARHDREALEAYETYLLRVPEAENRDYVATRISFLREAEARRAVPAPAGAAEGAQQPSPERKPGPALAVRDAPPAKDDGSVIEEVWFWAVIGVGAAAIATGVVVLASGEKDPVTGDIGGVVSALRTGSR